MKIRTRQEALSINAQDLVDNYINELKYHLNQDHSAQVLRHETKGFLRGLQLAGLIREFAVTYRVEDNSLHFGIKFGVDDDFVYFRLRKPEVEAKPAPASIQVGEVYIDLNSGELKKFTGSAWEAVSNFDLLEAATQLKAGKLTTVGFDIEQELARRLMPQLRKGASDNDILQWGQDFKVVVEQALHQHAVLKDR